MDGQGPRHIFECLMRLRLQVDGAGWLLCCNGARRDAFCSGTLRDVGGGKLVYLLENDLPLRECSSTFHADLRGAAATGG